MLKARSLLTVLLGYALLRRRGLPRMDLRPQIRTRGFWSFWAVSMAWRM